MREVHFKSYLGMGDSIHLRPIIRGVCQEYDTVYLETPWPELFWDLGNIKFVRRNTTLRTQQKNIDKQQCFVNLPGAMPTIQPRYDLNTLRSGLSIYEAFERTYKPLQFDFSMPTDPWDAEAEAMSKDWGRFALIRPCTIRREYEAPARNCKTQYIQDCVDGLKSDGVLTVGFADIDGVDEHLLEPFDVDISFLRGQTEPMLIAALMKRAYVTVAPVGFAQLMAVAVGAPIFVIYGGTVEPILLMDKRMDLRKYGYASPDPFCNCLDRRHQSCLKEIPNLRQTFTGFLERVQNLIPA